MDEITKDELEKIKLRLEIKQMNTPWFKKPILISIASVILTIFGLYIAYKTGLSEERNVKFSIEEKSFNLKKEEFERNKIKSEEYLLKVKDSIEIKKDAHNELIYKNTLQEIFIEDIRVENRKILYFLQGIVMDSTQSKSYIIDNTSEFLIKNFKENEIVLNRVLNKSFTKLGKELFDLPDEIESKIYRDIINKSDLIISLTLSHRNFPSLRFPRKWNKDLNNFGKILRDNVEKIIKENEAFVDEIIIIGNADQDPFRGEYNGAVGVIDNVNYTNIRFTDTIFNKKMHLDFGTPIRNLELAFIRGYTIKNELLQSSYINSKNIELVAKLNERGGSRNVEIIIKLKDRYSKYFSRYYYNEEMLNRLIKEYYQ